MEIDDLYTCEQCHLLFYRGLIDGKPGPAVIVCPECGNPWAVYWPDIPEGYDRKKEWPGMWTAYCE